MNNKTLIIGGTVLIVIIGLIAAYKYYNRCPNIFFERMGYLKPICDSSTYPDDISRDGIRVVGTGSADENNAVYPKDCAGWNIEAAGWTRTCPGGQPFYLGGMKGLIPLGYLLPSSEQASLAYGISPDGQVSVGYSIDINGQKHPVVILPSPVIKVLPFASPDTIPDRMGSARDISSKNTNASSSDWGSDKAWMQGRIIVGYSGSLQFPHQKPGSHAVYWDSWTHVVVLKIPVLPNGQAVISSEALCISDDGTIIGGNLFYNMQAEEGTLRSYPCVWKYIGATYVPQVLEDLPAGDINARITHISGDGQTTVGWGNSIAGDSTCDGYPQYACKWKFTGTATTNTWAPPLQLNPLPGTLKFSYASGVNQNGNVVVGSSFNYTGCKWQTGFFQSTATLWESGITKDVATILGPKVPAGYHLFGAIRVSGDGKIITGISYSPSPDFPEGWVGGR